MKTKCPDCLTDLVIPRDAAIGEIIECGNCGAECELLSKKPLKIEILEEEK